MSFTLLSLVIIILLATVSIIEIYRGVKRGFMKSLVSLATVVVSALISIIVSPLITQLIVDGLSINLVSANGDLYKNLARSLNVVIRAVISMVASTFVFVVIFFLVRCALGIVSAIVWKKALGENKNGNRYGKENSTFLIKNDKKFGAIAGAVSALIITMVLTSPIMGTLNVVSDTLSAFTENKIKISGLDKETVESLKKYSSDLPGNVLYHCGGKLMYGSAASAVLYDERVYLLTEVDTLCDAVENFSVVYQLMRNPVDADNHKLKSIDAFCENVEDMKLLKGVLAIGLANASEAWLNDNSFLYIKLPPMNRLLDTVFDEIFVACSKTDRESVSANITTVLQLYKVVIESDILNVDKNDETALIDFLDNSDIVKRFDSIIEDNPYITGVSASSIAFSIVVDKIKSELYDEEKYSVLMDNMAEALNKVNSREYGSDEEKVEVLTSYAMKYIKDYGYEISEDVAKKTAEELLKSFGKPGVTTNDLRKLFDEVSGAK